MVDYTKIKFIDYVEMNPDTTEDDLDDAISQWHKIQQGDCMPACLGIPQDLWGNWTVERISFEDMIAEALRRENQLKVSQVRPTIKIAR